MTRCTKRQNICMPGLWIWLVLPLICVLVVAGKTFEVKRASDNLAVFNGKLGPASLDADTGDSVQIADFTKLHEAEYSGEWQRNARHPERNASECGMDVEDAGRRRRRMAQADE